MLNRVRSVDSNQKSQKLHFKNVEFPRQMHVVIGVAVFSNANRNPVMAIAPIFSNDGAMGMCSKNFRVFGEWEF